MARFDRSIRRRVRRARRVERFVWLVVTGGLALVAGCWIAVLATKASAVWWVGIGLVVVGIGGLASGIRREIEY